MALFSADIDAPGGGVATQTAARANNAMTLLNMLMLVANLKRELRVFVLGIPYQNLQLFICWETL
jgi:hypothetical protein